MRANCRVGTKHAASYNVSVEKAAPWLRVCNLQIDKNIMYKRYNSKRFPDVHYFVLVCCVITAAILKKDTRTYTNRRSLQ